MGDLLRKGFLLGLGAAVIGKEKLESKLNDLVAEKEITSEQAQKVLQRFIEKGEQKKEEWSDKQKKDAQKMGEDLGFATIEMVKQLQARVDQLEKELTDKYS